ncbi:hypothetical protein O1L55_07625 [Streptomyces albulus]|nr:hypothetical protein [Streptomyces noursei]
MTSDAAQQAWQAAPRHTRQTWQLTALSAATGLSVAVVAVAAAGPWTPVSVRPSGRRRSLLRRQVASITMTAGRPARRPARRPC